MLQTTINWVCFRLLGGFSRYKDIPVTTTQNYLGNRPQSLRYMTVMITSERLFSNGLVVCPKTLAFRIDFCDLNRSGFTITLTFYSSVQTPTVRTSVNSEFVLAVLAVPLGNKM